MTGPGWLAGVLAAVGLTVALFGAARLLLGRLAPGQPEASRSRPRGETDADIVHVLMGVAMAGMFVPRLATLPGPAWEIVFAAGAAWFGWRAVRDRRHGASVPANPAAVGCPPAARVPVGRGSAGRGPSGNMPASDAPALAGAGGPEAAGRRWWCACPVPHLVDCLAMVYVLWAVPAAAMAGSSGGTAIGMDGMSAAAGSARLPALALILAAGICAYVVWLLDRIPAARLVPPASAGPGMAHGQPARRPGRHYHAGAPPLPAGLAPRAAACCKVAMGVAMGIMLISVL